MKVLAKYCRGCGVELYDEIWYASLRKENVAYCHVCYREKIPRRFCPGCGVVCAEKRCAQCDGERDCKKCGVKLTDANWYPAFQKRKLRRCKTCHDALVTSWEARHPGDINKRAQRWRDRNPEYTPMYYLANKEAYAQRAIERLWKLKAAAINMLGGQCVVCGITDLRVLDINHLNGRQNDKGKFGQDMYTIILDGTRALDDLDVRCCNHNRLYEYECGRRNVPTWFATEAPEDLTDECLDEENPDV